MKVTVTISDDLLSEARAVAERDSVDLGRLIENGLQLVVDRHRVRPAAASGTFRLRDASIDGNGLHPDFWRSSWMRLADLGQRGWPR